MELHHKDIENIYGHKVILVHPHRARGINPSKEKKIYQLIVANGYAIQHFEIFMTDAFRFQPLLHIMGYSVVVYYHVGHHHM